MEKGNFNYVHNFQGYNVSEYQIYENMKKPRKKIKEKYNFNCVHKFSGRVLNRKA